MQDGGGLIQTHQDGVPYRVHGFASTAGSNGGPAAAGGHLSGAPAPQFAGSDSAAPTVAYCSAGDGPSEQAALPKEPELLTHPSASVSNEGWDNENSDLIITTYDVLESAYNR